MNIQRSLFTVRTTSFAFEQQLELLFTLSLSLIIECHQRLRIANEEKRLLYAKRVHPGVEWTRFNRIKPTIDRSPVSCESVVDAESN